MTDLNPGIVALAIEAMDTSAFEAFGQVALSEALGTAFEPTGGVQDGGQDGFLRQRKGKPRHFIQISKEKGVRAKVRKTITRIIESGRDVDALTFLTSEMFPTRDEFEAEIEKETGVSLHVYDRSWLTLQIAKNELVSRIFRERSSQIIRNLVATSGSVIQEHTPAERMSVLVYMDAHARSDPQETDLLTLAADAAIYQALEGTDPDKGIFKTESEVIDFVNDRFPAVRKRPSLSIGVRLERLSAKKNNPRIRSYTKERKYCLPYDVRNELSQENEAIQRLEIDFLGSIRERAQNSGKLSDLAEVERVANAVHRSIAKTFERQGLNLAASFEVAQNYEEVRTFDLVSDELSGDIGDNERRPFLVEASNNLIREIFYSGNDIERKYIFQLFKLFSVEFIMKGDDRIAAYFKGMVSNLKLYIGTDIVIRCLSEACLRPENQSTQNALSLLRKAGAQLFITEQVLLEVYTHIIAENKEFEGHYQPWIQHATANDLRNSNKILIRAFGYAYFEPDRHAKDIRSWRNFLDLFGQADWFDKRDFIEGFAAFIQKKFSLDFVSTSTVTDGVSEAVVRRLRDAILARRATNEMLAENDARIALFINREREKTGERMSTNVYGYRTWWLTEEFHVVHAARASRIPNTFSMQPQFLMNFFAAAPALREVTENFGAFFPTNFGLRITDRVSEGTLRDFLKKANDAANQDDAVAAARIRTLSNQLKSAMFD